MMRVIIPKKSEFGCLIGLDFDDDSFEILLPSLLILFYLLLVINEL